MRIPRYLRTLGYQLVNILFWCCIVVVGYLLVQILFLSSFKVPTGSMEPTLQAGDYILVNKTIPGARLFNIFASIRGEEPEVYRMPGWRKIRRNDVVVFNYPYPGNDKTIRMDIMIYYVKRCVGLPGDSISIREGFYQVPGVKDTLGNREEQERALLRRSLLPPDAPHDPVYPKDSAFHWTAGAFGPLYIPAKGNVLPMDRRHYALYHKLIEWEQRKPVRIDDGGQVYIGDEAISTYQFQHNYYFMAGDHVSASLDSRYWGLMPDEYVVGKAWLIWKSINPDTGWYDQTRLFKKIR